MNALTDILETQRALAAKHKAAMLREMEMVIKAMGHAPHSRYLRMKSALELCEQSDAVTVCPSCDGFMIEGDESAEGESGQMHCSSDCLQEMYDYDRSRARGNY